MTEYRTDPSAGPQGSEQHRPQVPQTPYQATYASSSGQVAPGEPSAPAPDVSETASACKKKEKRSGASLGKTFLVAFAGALLACAVSFGVAGALGAFDPHGVSVGASSSSPVAAQTEDATLAEAVSAKCLPSVAAIDVYAPASSGMPGFYGLSSRSSDDLTQVSLGSGVVLTADGYIITNNHVVEGGSAWRVTIEGETYDADLVGADPSSDVAVLKARDAKDLAPIEIGDSDNLTIGEWVMSIGSPFGLEQSVATGIVSATSRSQIMNSPVDQFGNSTGEYTMYPNMIQTDAAINPGNSGGALVDADGKLIGINTLITSYSGNYSGVGFAIPVNYAVNLAQQIIDGKQPTHAQLGVSLSTVDSQIAKRFGFAVNAGAYVADVVAGSGAEKAGIEVGDIVTAFDGQPVASASDLMLDVRTKNPGDTVTITINRDGESKDVEVTLGSDEAKPQTKQQSEKGEGGFNPFSLK